MPRQLRIQYPGACYHVMARGNRRQAIVTSDEDRKLFVTTLGEVCGRTGWEVLAWVLMDNHYHWLIRTPEPNLVEGMKWFQNAYTRRFNVRHRDWGHLFGGRYRAIPVEVPQGEGEADYLSTLMDYIHLNPVRARLVSEAKGLGLLDYPWSSLSQGYALAAGRKRPAWMAVEAGLAVFGLRDVVAGRRRFVERLEERMKAERAAVCGQPREDLITTAQSTLERGWYWGSQAFMERLKALVGGQAKPAGRTLAASAESRAGHDEKEARRLLREGLEGLGLAGIKLEELPGSDPRKVALARVIHSRTAVSNGWLAEELKMKSADNVSQHLRRLARGGMKLDKKSAAWLNKRLKEQRS